MGNVFLKEPITEKESAEDGDDTVRCAHAAMQGWRLTMEDAHKVDFDFSGDGTLKYFAVFDGHGGKHVALACAEHLHNKIKATESWKRGDLKKAITEGFLGMDDFLRTPEGAAVLESFTERKPAEEQNDLTKSEEFGLVTGTLMRKMAEAARRAAEKGDGAGRDDANKRVAPGDTDQDNDDDDDEMEEYKLIFGNDDELEALVDNLRDAAEDSDDDDDDDDDEDDDDDDDDDEDDDEEESDNEEKGSDDEVEGGKVGKKADKDGESKGKAAAHKANGSPSSKGKKNDGGNGDGELMDIDDEELPQAKRKRRKIGKSPAGSKGGKGRKGGKKNGSKAMDESEDNEKDVDDESDEKGFQAPHVPKIRLRLADKANQEEPAGKAAASTEDEPTGSAEACGATAVVAVIRGDELIVANAGDSRCVLSRNGMAFDMSIDHAPTLDSERDRIVKAGHMVCRGRINSCLNLSRAIGDFQFKGNKDLPPEEQAVTANPEIKTTKLTKGDDFLVLACDGIWNSMTSQEVVDFVSEKLFKDKVSLKEAAEALCDACMAPDKSRSNGTGLDNETAVIVLFKNFMDPSKSSRYA